MPTPVEELARIEADEPALRFPHFDSDVAWLLGTWLRNAAHTRKLAIAIEVFANGMTHLLAAMPGAKPENAEWIRRKRNLVLRTFASSRATQLRLALAATTLEARTGLPAVDFAAAGGSIPIVVDGAGVIGALTISGLTSEADHTLGVEAIGAVLGTIGQG